MICGVMTMMIRRYYKKGVKYPYTICEDYLSTLVTERGSSEANRLDNASYEIVLTSLEEQKDWFFDCLQRVISNPRYYLDNLDKIPTFKVRIKEIFPSNQKVYKVENKSSNE